MQPKQSWFSGLTVLPLGSRLALIVGTVSQVVSNYVAWSIIPQWIIQKGTFLPHKWLLFWEETRHPEFGVYLNAIGKSSNQELAAHFQTLFQIYIQTCFLFKVHKMAIQAIIHIRWMVGEKDLVIVPPTPPHMSLGQLHQGHPQVRVGRLLLTYKAVCMAISMVN